MSSDETGGSWVGMDGCLCVVHLNVVERVVRQTVVLCHTKSTMAKIKLGFVIWLVSQCYVIRDVRGGDCVKRRLRLAAMVQQGTRFPSLPFRIKAAWDWQGNQALLK